MLFKSPFMNPIPDSLLLSKWTKIFGQNLQTIVGDSNRPFGLIQGFWIFSKSGPAFTLAYQLAGRKITNKDSLLEHYDNSLNSNNVG